MGTHAEDYGHSNECAGCANIPADSKAPATSKTNARVAALDTRTHGMGNDTPRGHHAMPKYRTS